MHQKLCGTTSITTASSSLNTTLSSFSTEIEAGNNAEIASPSSLNTGFRCNLFPEIWILILGIHCKEVKDLHNFSLASSMCNSLVHAVKDLPIRQFLSSEKAKEIFKEGIPEKLHDILLASRQAAWAEKIPQVIPHEEILQETLLKRKNPPLEKFIKSVVLKGYKNINFIPSIQLLLSKRFPQHCEKREEYIYSYPKMMGKDLIEMGLCRKSDNPAFLNKRIHNTLGFHLLMQLGQLSTQEQKFDIERFLTCNHWLVFDGLIKTYKGGRHNERELNKMLTTGVFFDPAGDVEPVLWAISNGAEDFLRKLLEANFNPNVFNEDGVSALDCAKEKEHKGMVDLLFKYGARERSPATQR